MIVLGVFKDGPSTWHNQVTKQWDLALFANSDFQDLELKPYTTTESKASDFTAKHLI
jgi:hypothetical protein